MIAASMRSIGTSNDHRVLSANPDRHLATRRRSSGTARRGASQAKASETMPMMAKWIGFMPTDCATAADRAENDDRRNRVEEAAHHQEHEGDEKTRRGDPHPPRGDVLAAAPWDLVVGEEQPNGRTPCPQQKSATEESRPVSTNES